jgi:fucose 4-O-acetylase-like acetyltransferase
MGTDARESQVVKMGKTMIKTARSKDFSIESLRGLAILLMVAGHVIGSTPERGMQAADDSIWHYYFVGLEDIRMPLFTLLSGYVYAYRPLGTMAAFPRMVKGKVRRLLVPLLTIGTIYFLTQALLPGTNSKPPLTSFWRTYVFSYEHFWFLQAIFLIFLLVALLDANRLIDEFRKWSVTFGLSAIAFILVTIPPGWSVFSMGGAIRLLPFFLLGCAMHRFAALLDRRRWMAVTIPVFAVVYGIEFLDLAGFIHVSGAASKLIGLLVGVSAVSTIILLRDRLYLRWLAWLGQFAFAIYLLHVFGSAGTRLVLGRAGIENELVVFTLCLAVAVALPILFEVTLGRVSWMSWAFLGQAPWRPTAYPPVRPGTRLATDPNGNGNATKSGSQTVR